MKKAIVGGFLVVMMAEVWREAFYYNQNMLSALQWGLLLTLSVIVSWLIWGLYDMDRM